MHRCAPPLLFLLLCGACQSEEHVVLLEVGSMGDVDTLEVTVTPIAGDGPTRRTGAVPVLQSRDEIAERPIRIGIPLDGPTEILVHLSGVSPTGELLVATRCYAASGVFRDSILLVGLDATEDADLDGFARRPEAACFDLDGSACPEDHRCPAALAADCDDRERCADPPPGTGCASDADCAVGEGCNTDSFVCMPTCTTHEDCAEGSHCDPTQSVCVCVPPETVHPGARTTCQDGIDQNCVDEDPDNPDDRGDEPCIDADGDGWTACSATGLPGTCDCDDDNPAVNPSMAELMTPPEMGGHCADGIDQDCDGIDVKCDRDGDGHQADRTVGGSPDCDDTNPDIHPGADEVCTPEGGTAVDEDCDGLVDELESCAGDDLDRDGYPHCPAGTTGSDCDCNDCDPGVHPGAGDACQDGVDADCSHAPGDPLGDPTCAPADGDRDGSVDSDCDDTDAQIFPGAPERCGDGIDQSCRGDAPCSADTDGDGYIEPAECEGNPAITPWTTDVCNGVDDDCSGAADELILTATVNSRSETLAQGDRGCVIAPARLIEFGCTPGTSCELDFRSNLYHCGGCRLTCNPGATTVANVCDDGGCDCSTEAGFGPCTVGDTCCVDAAGPAGPGCHNLPSDWWNCGACNDDRCAADGGRSDQCIGGECSCGTTGRACGVDERCCGGTCVRRDDPAHCGRCGWQCGNNSTCTASGGDSFQCSCNAVPGGGADWVDCNGDNGSSGNNGCEINPTNDRDNCGICGTRCRPANATGVCVSGTCRIDACNSGYADCAGGYGDGCEQLLNTLSHCGGCGVGCSRAHATPTCASGSCAISSCSGLWGNCNGTDSDGCETALNTTSNCGGCGTGCSRANATPTCSSGSCAIGSCSGGWGNCNGTDSDGCELQLNTTANCGGCGTTCSRAHATATCASGSCAIAACDPGWGNCNGTDSDGCEAPLNTTANCGGCGTTCSRANATATCATGSCAISSCDGGWGNCNGTDSDGCEDPLTSTANCGGCGTTCTRANATATCSTGSCAISSCNGGWGNCNGTDSDGCENPLSSTSDCGGCGTMCDTNETCTGGACCCGTSCGPVGGGDRCTGGGSGYCCDATSTCAANASSC